MVTYIYIYYFLKELVTLKTNELYQTMQKAQELAQRLKQEQRVRDLVQKGHDISRLQKNLSGGKYTSFMLGGDVGLGWFALLHRGRICPFAS